MKAFALAIEEFSKLVADDVATLNKVVNAAEIKVENLLQPPIESGSGTFFVAWRRALSIGASGAGTSV